MTGRAGRRPAKLLLSLQLALAGSVLFFVLTLLPVRQYVPVCGWPEGHTLRGPMRKQFVVLLAQSLAEHGFRYYRSGDTILVPVWPVFDGRDRFGWTDFQLNFPWRMALNIAHGVQIGPDFYRPPAPVLHLLGTEGPYGPYPRQKQGSSARYGPDHRFVEDCNLFRAAVLKVEAMPSEALPDLNAIDRARDARTAEGPSPRP